MSNRGNSDLLYDLSELVRSMRSFKASITEIKKVQHGQTDGIQLKNCFINRFIVLGCVIWVVLWGLCLCVMPFFEQAIAMGVKEVYFYMIVLLIITLIVTLIEGRIVLDTYRYKDVCYLTKDGVISVPILFGAHNSKFRLEVRYENGIKKKYVNVTYFERGKESNWLFEIVEQEEEAEEIIKKLGTTLN